MPTPASVVELVQRFADNSANYKSGHYNETQARVEFIDPLFVALGWDVNNTQGYAEAYKDVIHEDKVKVGGIMKAPDYSFRIGMTRKFFVEAKKPVLNLKSDVEPAFQLRRYAWSAKLPLSILTDFEEFAVYDGRIAPKANDGAGVARIRYYAYTDYLDKWDEISALFSKEAVLKGAFDRFADDKKAKRGTTEVDAAFLAEIEGWRNALAVNLAAKNPALSIRQLNFAVQKTIDRIIFLRICEDRGIEEMGRLLSLLNGKNVYERLITQFREADERYNSGLFHFQSEKGREEGERDTLSLTLKIEDGVLKDILKSLYYPSPYAFEVFPADILGQVYEQFLGKVIVLDSKHRASVEEKPEVRKAGGVYYTPTYIVDYIVQQTVGKLLENKTPKQAESLKILDPACGSGSFLIGAYQKLLDWHLHWYEADGAEKHAKGKDPKVYQTAGGGWRLTTGERRRILLNNIYGVDIDPQAVEVTKLSLLLKMLEGETQQTVRTQTSLSLGRVLPDLGGNIQCGNSLIGSGFYDNRQMTMLDEEEMYRVNAFDWHKAFPFLNESSGFDIVIGNPPYRMLQPHNTANEELDYLKRQYISASFKIELFHLFLQRGGELVRENGRLGFIVPTTITNNVYAQGLRNWITERFCIEKISVARGRVFDTADVHTSVVILRREVSEDARKANLIETTTNLEQARQERTMDISVVEQNLFNQIDGNIWNILINRDNSELIVRLQSENIRLKGISELNRGLITGSKADYFSSKQISDLHVPILTGSDVHRYSFTRPSQYVLFQRPDSAGGCWDRAVHFSSSKIVVRQIGRKPTATLILEPIAVTGNIFTIRSENLDTERYLLGIVNSSLIAYFWNIMFSDFKESFPQVTIFSLSQIPIRVIDVDKPVDVERHTKMVGLVEQMLSLNLKLAAADSTSRTFLQRQIETTDAQIDRLVYELYGLSPEEIAIVESNG